MDSELAPGDVDTDHCGDNLLSGAVGCCTNSSAHGESGDDDEDDDDMVEMIDSSDDDDKYDDEEDKNSDSKDESGVKKRLTKSEKKRKRYEEKIAYKKAKRKLDKEIRKTRDRENPNISRRTQSHMIKERVKEAMVSGQKICVDWSLESHMSEKECSRLAQQLGRLYGCNRQSEKPAHIYFTGINKSGHLYQECMRKNSGFENYMVEMREESHLDIFKLDEIVYLSPNSPNILETVEQDKVYVIGGLVDESVQKNVTQSRAEKVSIRTARLPISEYMEKSVSGSFNQILTINQVFAILLAYIETADWTSALICGLPQRKGFVPRKDKTVK